MGEVQSSTADAICGQRNQSEKPALPRRPQALSGAAALACPVSIAVEKTHNDVKKSPKSDEENDDGKVLGPCSDELPRGLVKRLAALMAKEDPYISREIAEQASECSRFQFLKQCRLGGEERCKEIWGSLDDRDRREFYRACQLDPSHASELFFLDILEPDSKAWTIQGKPVVDCYADTDCGSVMSDLELPPSCSSVASDVSFSSMASVPRRRFAC